jgi:transcription antitermination protein NusB
MNIPLQSKRGQGRLSAMRFMYEFEMNSTDELQKSMEDHFTYLKIKDGIAGYARKLIEGSLNHQEQIDKIIADNLSNWTLDRLTVIDRNVLRLGVYELVYAGDVPYNVTINEMVEVAKQFGTADSAGFTNGVLDSVRKKLEAKNNE